MRIEIDFNKSWEFLKLAFGTELADIRAIKDEEWEKVADAWDEAMESGQFD